MSNVIPGYFGPVPNNAFAARQFTVNTSDPNQTINFTNSQINNTTNLTIGTTPNSGVFPNLFRPGEQYALTWQQGSTTYSMTGTITRSDVLGSGEQLVVFTGVRMPGGQTFTLVLNLNGVILPSNQVSYYTNDRFDTTVGVCFVAGTRIATPAGAVPVEALRVGDWIETRDHGPQRVRWIGRRRVGLRQMAANPRLRPIRVAAGSLGRGLPERDLSVSLQHRLLVTAPAATHPAGAPEAFAAAVHLVGRPGIGWAEPSPAVDYLHLMCDRHEVIRAEGAPTETLYAGPMALKGIAPAARLELLALFPELARPGFRPVPARPLLDGRQARALAAGAAPLQAGA